MKRRLEIARGLLHHPTVLFLDEPTLGLDPQTRNHMWSYLQDLNKSEGITVFFTTHYMEEAERIAQRIAIIDHGKIIASGTAAELKAKTGNQFPRERIPEIHRHRDPRRRRERDRQDALAQPHVARRRKALMRESNIKH